MADFQQYYGLDLLAFALDAEECNGDVLRASILAAQLPDRSRTRRKLNPLYAVDTADQLLRRIEYDLQCIAYGLGGGDEKPQPFEFDGEAEQGRRVAEANVRRSRDVAAAFGLDGMEAVIG